MAKRKYLAKANVWVTPARGGIKKVFFAAGEELPDWAAKKLGSHIVDGKPADPEPSTKDGAGTDGQPDENQGGENQAGGQVGENQGGDGEKPDYSKWNVGPLKDEISKRNEGRDEDEEIEVDEPGNKPELIAALQADDAAQAAKAAGGDGQGD